MGHRTCVEARGWSWVLALTLRCFKWALHFVLLCVHEPNWPMSCWGFSCLQSLIFLCKDCKAYRFACYSGWLYIGFRDLNSCPHAFTANTLPTYESLQPSLGFLIAEISRKIDTWHPWSWTIILSMLNVNFGKNKQFLWVYPAGENSMNKDMWAAEYRVRMGSHM